MAGDRKLMTAPIIEALEPCPMCGDQPIRNGRGNVGGLICTGIGSDPRYAHRVQAYGSTQAEAEAAWNTRVSLKSPPIDLDPNGEAVTCPCGSDESLHNCSYAPTGPARSEGRQADLEALVAGITDPTFVHVNMLRGSIAKPSIVNIIHLYGEKALRASLPPEPACSSGEGRVRELLTCLLDNIEESGGYPAFEAMRGRAFDAACRDALKFLYGVQTDA